MSTKLPHKKVKINPVIVVQMASETSIAQSEMSDEEKDSETIPGLESLSYFDTESTPTKPSSRPLAELIHDVRWGTLYLALSLGIFLILGIAYSISPTLFTTKRGVIYTEDMYIRAPTINSTYPRTDMGLWRECTLGNCQPLRFACARETSIERLKATGQPIIEAVIEVEIGRICPLLIGARATSILSFITMGLVFVGLYMLTASLSRASTWMIACGLHLTFCFALVTLVLLLNVKGALETMSQVQTEKVSSAVIFYENGSAFWIVVFSIVLFIPLYIVYGICRFRFLRYFEAVDAVKERSKSFTGIPNPSKDSNSLSVPPRRSLMLNTSSYVTSI